MDANKQLIWFACLGTIQQICKKQQTESMHVFLDDLNLPGPVIRSVSQVVTLSEHC